MSNPFDFLDPQPQAAQETADPFGFLDPLKTQTPADHPLPPSRPTVEEEPSVGTMQDHPAPPPRPLDILEQLGLMPDNTHELPKDHRLKDPMFSDDRGSLTLEDQAEEVNSRIASAEKAAEEARDRYAAAKQRHDRVMDSWGDRPVRPGSQTAIQFDIIKEELAREERALAAATQASADIRKVAPPTLTPGADAGRRGLEAAGKMLPDAAAGAARIPDAIFGTDLASGPKAVSDAIGKTFVEDPARAHEMIAQLGQGAGSAIGFVVGGLGAKAVGVGAGKASTLLGGFQGAEERYTEAEKLGKSGWDLAKNYAAGFAIGGTEGLIGVGKMLDDLDRVTGGGVKRYVGFVLKEKGEEGLQEGMQTLLSNLADRGLLDQNKPIEEGVGRAALIGALIGGGMASVTGGAQMIAERMAGVEPPPPADIQAALMAELRAGPAPITQPAPGAPNVQPQPVAPRGTGAGPGGTVPLPATPAQADPLAAGAHAAPGPAATHPGDGAVGEVADPESPVAGPPDLGSVPGGLGTEALDPQQETEIRLLLGDGWDLETIQDLSSAERAQALLEASERGTAPFEGTLPNTVSHETQRAAPEGGPVASVIFPSNLSAPHTEATGGTPAPAESSPAPVDSGNSGEKRGNSRESGEKVPTTAAELRERLPKDEHGETRWDLLAEATEATLGESRPWARLTPEQKQAAWDHLNGRAAPQTTRDEGAGQAQSAPVGQEPTPQLSNSPERNSVDGVQPTKTGASTPPQDTDPIRAEIEDLRRRAEATGNEHAIGWARTLEENPASGQNTTVQGNLRYLRQTVERAERDFDRANRKEPPQHKSEGTRLTWDNLSDWTDGAWDIAERRGGAPQSEASKRHWRAFLPHANKLIEEADANTLRRFIATLRESHMAWSKPYRPFGEKDRGSDWERVHQLATDRLAQIEQGRADKPKTPRQDKREPKILAEHLMRAGGIADDDTTRGELRARDLHSYFRPGWGRLVRKDGMALDKAREMARDLGFLPEHGTIDDLLNLLEDEARGDYAETLGEQNAGGRERPIDRDQEQAEAASAISEALEEAGLPRDQIESEALHLAADYVLDGESDLLNAYERAVVDLEAKDPAVAAEMEAADIPFDEASNEDFEADSEWFPGRDDGADPEEESGSPEEVEPGRGGEGPQAGQRPAGNRADETEGGGSAGVLEDTRPERESSERDPEVEDESLLDALEAVDRGEDIKEGAVRKALVERKWVKGATKLKVSAEGKRVLEDGRKERRARAELAAKLALLPDDMDGLIEKAKSLIDPYNDAVEMGDKAEANKLREQLDLVEVKAHSLEPDWDLAKPRFGIATDESPAQQIRDALRAKPGQVPKWGQSGAFVLEVEGTKFLITHGDMFGGAIHATTTKEPFPSGTGFHSLTGYHLRDGSSGDTVEGHWRGTIQALLRGNGKTGTQGVPPAKMEMPTSAYRVRQENEGTGERSDKGVIGHMGAMRAYYLLENKNPDLGAPEPVYNKQDFRDDLTDSRNYDGRKNASTAVGPNGAEYFITYRTLRDAAGLTTNDVTYLYKREGKTITKLAEQEHDFAGRWEARKPLIEKAIEDAFDGFEEAPSERGKPEPKKPAKAAKAEKPQPFYIVYVSNDAVDSLKAAGVPLKKPLLENEVQGYHRLDEKGFAKLREVLENSFNASIGGPDMPKGWGATRTFAKNPLLIDQKRGENLTTVTFGGKTFQGVHANTAFKIERERDSIQNSAEVAANRGHRMSTPEWDAAVAAEREKREKKALEKIEEWIAKDKAGRPTLAQQIAAIKNHGTRSPFKAGDKLYSPHHKTGIQITQEAIDAAGVPTNGAPAEPKADKWKQIGFNKRGRPLFEDENGVRSYTENGIRITESVGIIPGGGISIDTSKRGSDFSLRDEEKGAEGKPQTLIPGVNPVTDGDRIGVKADKPLAPKVPQKEPGGLFGDSMNQGDLLDAIASPQTAPGQGTKVETDDVSERLDALRDQLVVFASGMSRIPELTAGGFVTGGLQSRGIGVEINELSNAAMKALAREIVQRNVQVFVDSGAFGIFRRNLKNKAAAEKAAMDLFGEEKPAQWQVLDSNEVLARYEKLQDFIAEQYDSEGEPDYPKPLLVMPDVVGDQAASLELVRQFAREIKTEAEFNLAKPIVPIQKGELSMAEAYAQAVEILGTDKFIVGVPSNAAAMSDEDLRAFLTEAKPKGLHFLGAAAKGKLDAKLRVIAESGVQLEHLSADGNILRGSLYGTEQPGDKSRPEQVAQTLTDKSPEVIELSGGTLADHFADKLANYGPIKNIAEARKIAKEYGVEDVKKVEETLELAVVMAARQIVRKATLTTEQKFDRLHQLYVRQPTLGTRTSTSMLNQAYSTPIPLAYVASRLAGIDEGVNVFEPTAGNGALLIEANPQNVHANEINDARRANLQGQGFHVTGEDASDEDLATPRGPFDVIIANPPFGTVKDEIGESTVFDLGDIQKGYRTKEIDHAIALRSLRRMKSGAHARAVLIIGSVNPQKDRSQGYRGKAKNEFFLTLLKNYNVTDIFTVDGDLYKKQGAGWPVDVIVIEGRGASKLDHPAKTVPPVLSSWDEVKAKLDAQRSATGSHAETSVVHPDGGGRGHSGRDPGSVGASGEQGPASDSSVNDGSPVIRPERDPGEPAPANNAGGRAEGDGRGNDRGNDRGPAGAGSALTAEDAVDAAIDELFGEEEAAPAPHPKAEEIQRFRDALARSDEAWAPDQHGNDIKHQIKQEGGRLTGVSHFRGAIMGSSHYTNRKEVIDLLVERAYGGGKPDEVANAVRMTKLRMEEALDAAIGRNGAAKNPESAKRDIEVALKYLQEDVENHGQAALDAVAENIKSLKKAAKAVGVEVKIPKAPKPKAPKKAPAKEIASGIKEAGEGLMQLFGPGNGTKLNSGFTFDEDTYAKAKPHFLKAIAHLKNAAADIMNVARELVAYMRDTLGATKDVIEKMRPYLVRFVQQVQDGSAFRKGSAPSATDMPQDLTETEQQVAYTPKAKIGGLGTLIPANMRTATEAALANLEERVGPLERFVGKELDYEMDAEGPFFIRNGQKERPFAAEQVDALALAIDNMNKGAALIIGDQTGIGKGRVNGGILRYAIAKKAIPIFVTKDPGLYKDIYRDITDIGLQEYLGREPRLLMTDANKTIPLDEEERMVLKTGSVAKHNDLLKDLAAAGDIGDYDILITSYSQMQTVNGAVTDRMRFLEAIAPQAIIAMDESHNAGGQGPGKRDDFDAKLAKWERARSKALRAGRPFNRPRPEEGAPDRAQFSRILIDRAKAAFYSSATYAKRPDVMDLYRKTDMRLAVDSIEDLGAAIQEGGVPMQQVVAAQLAQAGQYVRRERSFAGVTYEPSVVPVDEEVYDSFSTALRLIQDFSKKVAAATAEIDGELAGSGEKVGHDNATGEAGASSMNFTSIMHNLINQMLLAINAQPAAEAAIAAVRRGEKPLIAVAGTNESFLSNYADEAGLKAGDAVDVNMSAMLNRYLERTRWISIREPFMEAGDEATKVRLTDEQLGPDGVAAFEEARAFLRSTDFSALPASPIDHIKFEMERAGVRVGEITGRTLTIKYHARPTGGGKHEVTQKLWNRPGEERSTAGKNKTISLFNGGDMDALILNQSGSTGLSMHASARFKDQSKRLMIIAQPEANIDTHMQMLGRVHRTGQVKLPAYIQLIPDVPAAKRPAAILLKKMASLNANTTASRKGSLSIEGVVDFMNEYGDRVAANIVRDDPDLNDRLDYPVNPEAKTLEGAMRKMTGRIPLLPIDEQRELYEKIESEYQFLLEQMEAEGRNTLEAKTLELDAIPVRRSVISEATGPSPFQQSVVFTEYDVKRQGKPYTLEELRLDLAKGLEVDPSALPESLPKALAKAEELGQFQVGQMNEEAKEGWDAFVRRYMGRLTDETKIEAQRTRLNAVEQNHHDLTNLLYPGARVRLKYGEDESMTGLVLRVTPAGEKATNPLAPGQWRAKIAVPSGERSREYPFNRFVIGKDPENDEIALEPAGWAEPVEATIRLFELAAQAEQRETRVIATGNMLKAFTGPAKRGTIINFRTHEGAILPGIMLRARVRNLADALGEQRVDINLDQLARDLQDPANVGVPYVSADTYLTLTATGYSKVIITANRARDKGGKYTLNRGVLAITGDFVSRGGVMRAEAYMNQLPVLLPALQAAGARFTKPADVAIEDLQAPKQNQIRTVPGFYSSVERAVEAAKTAKAPANQWLATLRNAQGVKAEEMAWLGLEDWLVGQAKASLTKDEVLAFVRENKLYLTEITRQGPTEAEIIAKAEELREADLEETLEDRRDRNPDLSTDYWAEAVQETEEFDEDSDEHPELTGRWTYMIHGDGEAKTSWRTYDSEEEAQAAGDAEAERMTNRAEQSIRTDIANQMRPWEYYLEQARDALVEDDAFQPSYSGYKTEGGDESYREHLIQLPLEFTGKDGAYKSGHWREPNVLAHFRTTERTVDGQRTLFIEEIQSDWHQAGRKQGYRTADFEANLKREAEQIDEEMESLGVTRSFGGWRYQYETSPGVFGVETVSHLYPQRDTRMSPEAYARALALSRRYDELQNAPNPGVPDAPFKTSWQDLALKRILRMAVDEGYDQIAWTGGDMQNLRYGLEKHIDSLIWTPTVSSEPNGPGTFQAYDHNGTTVVHTHLPSIDAAEEFIGAEIAAKLKAATPDHWGGRRLDGQNLRSGGEGMRGFYDKILLDAANRIGKKFGAKAMRFGGRLATDGGPWKRIGGISGIVMAGYPTREEAERWTRRGETIRYEPGEQVHVMPIPATMKLAATVDGFSQFKAKGVTQEQADAARLAIVAEIHERIIGDRVPMRVESIETDRNDAAWQRSLGGREDEANLQIVAQYAASAAGSIIRISAENGDIEAIHHEVFHAFQHLGGFTHQEVALLERERERNRRTVAQAHGITYEEAKAYSDDEVDAYASGLYAYAMEANAPGMAKGLHIGLRRPFERVRQVLRRIINLLRGYGFRISDDIFESVRRGDMKRRLDRGERGIGYGPVYDWQVTRDAALVTQRGFDEAARSQNTIQPTFSRETIEDIKRRNTAAGMPPRAPAGNPPSFPTPAKTRMDAVRESQQDSFRFLDKLQASIEEARGAPIPDPQNAYQAQTLYHGRAAERLDDFKRSMVDPLVEEIKTAGVTSDEIGLYLIAKHAAERNQLMAERDPKRFAQDGGSGMADAVADDLILEFRAAGKEPALERIAQRVYAIIATDVDNRHNAGLISDDTRDAWENLFPSGRYVPLRGYAERDEDNATGAYGRGFDIRGREAKIAFGRESLSDNPLDAVIEMAEQGIIRSEKNRVGKTLLRLVRNNPNPEVWSIVRNPTTKVLRENPQTGAQEMREIPNNLEQQRENVLGVKVGGVPYYIELADPSLARAFKRLGVTGLPPILARIQPLMRMYSQLQTGRNPEFFIRNAFRDIQEAITYTSTISGKLAKDVAKNLFPAMGAALRKAYGFSAGGQWDAIYEEWRSHGGRISNYSFRDIDAIHRDIQKELSEIADGRIKRMSKTTLRGIIAAIDNLNEAFESATRLAVYKAARQNGMTKEKAAAHARQATINFTKRGNASATMNVLYVFYNASVQGSAKNLELLARSKRMRVAWASLVGLGFAMNMLGRAWGEDDEEGRRPFDEVADFARRKNIIIPYGLGKDAQGNARLKYIQVPLMFGFTIPYYLGDQIASVLNGTVSPQKAAWNTLTNTVDAFNPIGDGQLLTMILPTLAKPVGELLLNSDYRGYPIYPNEQRWNEGIPKSSQPTNITTHPYMVDTTEAINRWTGGSKFEPGAVDLYPGAIQYSLEWATGGLGRFVLNSGRFISDQFTGEETPYEKMPLARQFMGETNGQGEASRYYEIRGEVEEAKNRFRNAKKAVAENPDDEDARQVLEKEADRLGVSPDYRKKTTWKGSAANAFTDTDEEIRELRAAKYAIRNDSKLTRLEQFRRMQAIDGEIQALQRNARGLFKSKTRAP